MAEGSTLASLTRICALCNRAEFRPGQVCCSGICNQNSNCDIIMTFRMMFQSFAVNALVMLLRLHY